MADNYTLTGDKKYYMKLTLGRYTRPQPLAPASTPTTEIIFLPLPTELRDDTTVSYNPVNLETVGDIFNSGNDPAALTNAAVARNAGSILNAGLGMAQGGFSRVLERAGTLGRATAALSGGFIGMVQSLLPPEQINAIIQQKNGIAPNPNPSVSFQGPVLRDFTMTWAFYPKNKTEADNIKRMTRILKSRALPTWNNGNGSAVLNYPYMCQINFWPWDDGGSGAFGWSDNTIIKIKKCFMSGVNVNYNAFGTPAFFEGEGSYPTTIQLTISFKEIEYLTAEDWDPDFATAAEAANPSFSATNAVAAATTAIGGAFDTIVSGTIDVFGEQFLGALTPDQQSQQQALTAVSPRIDSLPADGSDPLVFNGVEAGLGTTTSYQWVVAGAEGGKYTVVKTTTINTAAGPGEPVEDAPVTFNTREELDAYLLGADGPLVKNAQAVAEGGD